MRQTYDVTGMHCAGCAAHVEQAARGVPGVSDCSVSLLARTLVVEGTPAEGSVEAAVARAGFGARLAGAGDGQGNPAEKLLKDEESPQILRRLWTSLPAFAGLVYFLLNGLWPTVFPLPAAMRQPVASGCVQGLLALFIVVVNRTFFVGGGKSLLHGAPSMDTLVALGAGAAFLSGCWTLGRNVVAGNGGGMYSFDSAGMILTLITVGKWLEARAKGRTADALASLVRLSPRTARVERGGSESEVPAAEVRPGDVFVVRPGEHVPVDGVVLAGSGGAVDESALTGESVPVDKAAGDEVSTATANVSGFLRCRATRVGQDTTLAQIIRTVADATATKAPIARLADRVAGKFVPAVMLAALATLVVQLACGRELLVALEYAVAVLVVACPCALGLATPVAITAGSGAGARMGILFKTAAALETVGRARIVAIDKTGTLTEGRPQVTELLAAGAGEGERALLALALALEKPSEHPLAKAIVAKAEAERAEALPGLSGWRALPGAGVEARGPDGETWLGGSLALVLSRGDVPQEWVRSAETLAHAGKTPILFARGGQVVGLVAVADALREESRQAIGELREMGLRTLMLTGDNERTAQAVAREAGVDDCVAGVRPEGKADAVRKLKEGGTTIMVGDGINDAPALACADVGMAVATGTDVAVDAAEVVLLRSRPLDISAAVRLGRATLRIVRENLFWALFYNILLIPVAAGAWEPLLGIRMHPALSAAAMGLSSLFVVANALRLSRMSFRP